MVGSSPQEMELALALTISFLAGELFTNKKALLEGMDIFCVSMDGWGLKDVLAYHINLLTLTFRIYLLTYPR